MVFRFTFTSILPESLNPFSYLYSSTPADYQEADPGQSWTVVAGLGERSRRPPRPSRRALRESYDHMHSTPRLAGYKRGWEPYVGPSTSAMTDLRPIAGDMYTPAMYVETTQMASRAQKVYGGGSTPGESEASLLPRQVARLVDCTLKPRDNPSFPISPFNRYCSPFPSPIVFFLVSFLHHVSRRYCC